MRTRSGGWLVPTFVGPWVSIAIGVTVAIFLFDQWDPLLGGRFANWIVAMIVGTMWSAFLSGALISVDIARGALGASLPEGTRAWVGGVLAVAIAWGLYTLFPPGRHDGLAWWWAATWPNVVAAIVARVLTWRKRSAS